jgi:hypothetical protein
MSDTKFCSRCKTRKPSDSFTEKSKYMCADCRAELKNRGRNEPEKEPIRELSQTEIGNIKGRIYRMNNCDLTLLDEEKPMWLQEFEMDIMEKIGEEEPLNDLETLLVQAEGRFQDYLEKRFWREIDKGIRGEL